MELLLSAFLIVQVLGCVGGYPSGAPTGACEDMLPRHTGVTPQSSPAPYRLLTNASTFQPGQAITVMISGPEYRGVLLEARTADSTSALGSWRFPPPDTKFLQCSGNPQSAVTHSNTNLKGNSTVFSWMPPNSMKPIFFKATVAQQRAIYWINVKSHALLREKAGLSLATGASAGMAKQTPLLILLVGLLMADVFE